MRLKIKLSYEEVERAVRDRLEHELPIYHADRGMVDFVLPDGHEFSVVLPGVPPVVKEG